ncbi:MAG: hypothetical protein KGI27_03310 [Thaumarchaeota archaeon]|nr:hypothetical protein [Nitrososphaerota archaeon]
MKRSTRSSILITSFLMAASGMIYLASSYAESAGSNDVGSQVQTMFFATAGIVCIPLSIWMLKNRLHSRAPYVISILVSAFLIILYVISRTVSLPVVGIQNDIGAMDILTKVIQVGIVVISVILLRDLKKEQVLPPAK